MKRLISFFLAILSISMLSISCRGYNENPNDMSEELIEEYYYNAETNEDASNSLLSSLTGLIYSIFYTVKNIKISNEFIYTDEFESYWYDENTTVDTVYEMKKGVKKSLTKSLPDSFLEKSLGFKTVSLYKLSTDFKFTVPKSKRINVKVYALYQRYSFELCSRFSHKVISNSYIDKPVGLYIKKTTYKL